MRYPPDLPPSRACGRRRTPVWTGRPWSGPGAGRWSRRRWCSSRRSTPARPSHRCRWRSRRRRGRCRTRSGRRVAEMDEDWAGRCRLSDESIVRDRGGPNSTRPRPPTRVPPQSTRPGSSRSLWPTTRFPAGRRRDMS